MNSFTQILKYANEYYLAFSFKVYMHASYSWHTYKHTQVPTRTHNTVTEIWPRNFPTMYNLILSFGNVINDWSHRKFYVFLLWIHFINTHHCFFFLIYFWVYSFSSIPATSNPWTTSCLDYFKRLLIFRLFLHQSIPVLLAKIFF